MFRQFHKYFPAESEETKCILPNSASFDGTSTSRLGSLRRSVSRKLSDKLARSSSRGGYSQLVVEPPPGEFELFVQERELEMEGWMRASESSEDSLDAAAFVWSKKLDDETRLEYHERAQHAFDLSRRARKGSLPESQPSKGLKSCFETCSSSVAGLVQAAKEHAVPYWTARRSPKSVFATQDSPSATFEAEWSTPNVGISPSHELGPLGCGVPGRTAAMLIGSDAGEENASPNKPVA